KLVGLVLLALGGLTRAAQAGVQDSPLPTFSTGRPALLVGMLPSVQSLNNLETLVTCTNLGAGVADIGLEVFDHLGRRANTIANGTGPALTVGAGRTAPIATGHPVALHEDFVVTPEPPVAAPIHGTGRVVASLGAVRCTAIAVDQLHDFRDPAKRPDMPPSIGQLDVLPTTTSTSIIGGTTTTTSTSLPPTTTTSTSSTTTTSHTTSTSTSSTTSPTTATPTSTSTPDTPPPTTTPTTPP